MKLQSLFYLSLLLLSIACSKPYPDEKDFSAPVITLNTPTDNQVYAAGETITISGNATDNIYIEEIHIEITNLLTAEQYLHVHIHPAASNFNFNQSFTALAATSYKIRVIADDPSSNSAVKSIAVSTN